MKTVIAANQLSLFAGSSLKQAVGTAHKHELKRIRIASNLKTEIRDKFTYPSGAIRVSLEFKVAYAELVSITPRKLRKKLREFMDVNERTHYRWIKDAAEVVDGTGAVRTYLRRG